MPRALSAWVSIAAVVAVSVACAPDARADRVWLKSSEPVTIALAPRAEPFRVDVQAAAAAWTTGPALLVVDAGVPGVVTVDVAALEEMTGGKAFPESAGAVMVSCRLVLASGFAAGVHRAHVLEHELGHCLGLRHDYDRSQLSVMAWSDMSPSYAEHVTPHDLDVLRQLYSRDSAEASR